MKTSQVAPRSGWVGIMDGKEVAIYNDGEKLIILENVCTHRGCQTGWNAADSSWDCPCHGSRFRADGTVLQGPARRPLPQLPFTVGGDGEIGLG